MLRKFSLQVETAPSGHDAIKKITSGPEKYDLVFMDWKMPEMDGIQTSKIIQEHCRTKMPPTIIMISAYAEEEIVQMARAVGIEIFLQKPVNPSLLYNIILGVFGLDIEHGASRQICENDVRLQFTTLAGSNILLVEDNDMNREIILALLEIAPIKVDIARDGVEAVEIYRANPFKYDLILMDIQMPGMDGYDATACIREIDDRIPIIALSANAMKEDVDNAHAAGMNGHISKPIDVNAFYLTLLKHMKTIKDARKYSDIESEKHPSIQKNEHGEAPFPILDFKHMNTLKALSHMGNDMALYIRVLIRFAESYKNSGKEIADLLSLGRIDDAARLVHTIKGIAGNIGAMELFKITQALEKDLSLDKCLTLQASMAHVINEIEEHDLKGMLSQMDGPQKSAMEKFGVDKRQHFSDYHKDAPGHNYEKTVEDNHQSLSDNHKDALKYHYETSVVDDHRYFSDSHKDILNHHYEKLIDALTRKRPHLCHIHINEVDRLDLSEDERKFLGNVKNLTKNIDSMRLYLF